MSTIVNIEDNSTGIAARRRSSVVIDPSEHADLMTVIVDAMKHTIRPGVECLDSAGRLHLSRFQADVGDLFVYDEVDANGAVKGGPVARAVYVRKGLDKRAVPMLPTGRVSTQRVKTDRGQLTIAIEREVT